MEYTYATQMKKRCWASDVHSYLFSPGIFGHKIEENGCKWEKFESVCNGNKHNQVNENIVVLTNMKAIVSTHSCNTPRPSPF